MKYYQLVKLAEQKAKQGIKLAEQETQHLTKEQKVKFSFPHTPHFDKGEVLPHHRIAHHVELKRRIKNVIDVSVKKQ